VQDIPSMPAVEKDVPDSILVTVNKQKTLMRSEARKMAREIAMRQGIPGAMVDQFLNQSSTEFEKEAVGQFVNRTLLDTEVDRQKIEVSEKEVDDVIAELKTGLPAGMSIEEALAARNMTMEKLRKDVAAGEAIQKLYKSKTADAKAPTDADVETFYNENKEMFNIEDSVEASHILIACDDKADADAHAKAKGDAETIRKQLVDGADFAKLATEKSSCPSKSKGGKLGLFKKGQMVPEFDTAAFSQEVGEIGPVVKTQYGYHIIKVTDKKKAGQQSLAEVSADIRKVLTARKQNEVFMAFLESLRKQAVIEYAKGYEPVEVPAPGSAPAKADSPDAAAK